MANKPGPKIDPARIARILVDAEQQGDKAAAETHNVSVRTVENYRAKYASDPRVADLCGSLREKITADWLAEAKGIRSRLIRRVDALAATHTNLREVAGALKLVHDAIMADELLTSGGQPDDRPGVGGEAGPGAPAAGAAGAALGGTRPTAH